MHFYPTRVCAGGVKRLLLSVRLSVCPWQNGTVGISEGLNNFYTWQKHIASVDFSMCVLDKLNSPVCRRTWLESLWYRHHFLPCVASYPGFCLQDCYNMCNNDSWLARGMCAPHTSSLEMFFYTCFCAFWLLAIHAFIDKVMCNTKMLAFISQKFLSSFILEPRPSMLTASHTWPETRDRQLLPCGHR